MKYGMAVPFEFHGHRSLTIGVPAGMFCGWKARSNGRGHGSCQSALYSWTLPIGIRCAQRTEKYPSGSVQRAVVFHPEQSLRLLCRRPLFLDAPTGVNGATCSVVRQKEPGNLKWGGSLGNRTDSLRKSSSMATVGLGTIAVRNAPIRRGFAWSQQLGRTTGIAHFARGSRAPAGNPRCQLRRSFRMPCEQGIQPGAGRHECAGNSLQHRWYWARDRR
jgi:hypothetical protein